MEQSVMAAAGEDSYSWLSSLALSRISVKCKILCYTKGRKQTLSSSLLYFVLVQTMCETS